jgi:starch synthase
LRCDRQHLPVPWFNSVVSCSVWFGYVHGRKCFFIEPHSSDYFFERSDIYGFSDDALRFAFFAKAALEFMLQSNKRPDVIHCHEWHTALLPVLLFEIYQHHGMAHQRVCYTIHNFRHQGVDSERILWATGLGRPEHYFHEDRLRDPVHPGAINLMKGGIVYSNFVTTVSSTHAWEARQTEQAFGLGHTLHVHQRKFGGVRNGIDYDTWNPAIDPLIPHRYDVDTLDRKYLNKDALRERFWLRKTFAPLIAYVGRLDSQKGVHLIRHALFCAIRQGAQFVALGPSPDPSINSMFWELKQQFNDHPDVHLELRFDDELAHLVYAGADVVVMPSYTEPCGLVQMIAQKYGAVPVVRSVGGLAETVFDRDYSDRPLHQRSGYVFHQADERGLESALNRAIGLWYDYPHDFRTLMVNGMRTDYSWQNPGQDYINIYDYIRHK